MEKLHFIQPLIFFFLLFLQAQSLSVSTQETDDEHEFNYDEEGEKGPRHWGEMHPDWSTCGTGRSQSPINLMNSRVEIAESLGPLKTNYKPANATLKNRGHDMMLKWEGGAGSLEINGTEYVLQQCHWHSPSEHTVNGRRFSLELHMVHQSSDGKAAVVGKVYKLGRPDDFLSSLMKALSATDETEEEKKVGVLNPNDIKIDGRKYYRYIGSLTVPPCTENVVWTVLKKVKSVSTDQLKLLHVAVHDESDSNARPAQAINDRRVQVSSPE